MPNTPLPLLACACLALAGTASAADMHTQVIASTCFSCHGAHGKSLGKIPNLAGVNKEFFLLQMKEFKSGERPSTIMKRHASGYTEAELQALGDFFASMK